MSSHTANRPNIITVVSDDQGPWALGCAGASDVQTPSIDALARDGVRMENFYCASPVCSPARASLLTGRMPSAHGVHDWIRGEAYGVRDQDDISYLERLSTTPELLSHAGYATGFAGKWHLGTSRRPAPGFEFWYAHRTGDGPYYGAPVWKSGERVSESRYITDAITEEALAFLARCRHDPRPFYLTVNYTAPHSPWVGQHPRRYLDLYGGSRFDSCPRLPPHPWFSWEPGPISDAMRSPDESLQGYYASITAMDAGIGQILRYLAEHGLRDDTVVVFTSDNGFSCGHNGVWGKGNATWPLNVWEESVKVPFVLSGPVGLTAGRTMEELASACDLHFTLLDLAQVAAPEDPLAAGSSLLPLLQGSGTERESVLVFDEYGGTRMIRTDEWKYVDRSHGPEELYHLSDDPDEDHDLSGDRGYAGRRRELHGLLHDWFAAHSTVELDAFDRGVSGRGQLQPAGTSADDTVVYQPSGDEVRVGRDPATG